MARGRPSSREIIDGELYCVNCGNWKPLDDYYKDESKRIGYQSYCKVCNHELNMQRYYDRRSKRNENGVLL